MTGKLTIRNDGLAEWNEAQMLMFSGVDDGLDLNRIDDADVQLDVDDD